MKKVVALLCVFAMLATMMAGCGSSTSSAPTPPASSGEAAPSGDPAAPAGGIEDGAKLVYWPMWAETEPQGMVVAQAIDAFTAATGVEVEVNWAGGRDTRKTLTPALDAGQVVDVFDEDIERVNITWGKYIMDIQGMYDASKLNGAQNATLINLAKELGGGSMKSVPYQPSTFLMMYNKDAFDKAGITAVPKTWDEFLAACEALKTAGIIPLTVDDAYMAAFYGYMMDRTVGFDTTKAVAAGDFTNPAVLETATIIEDMVKKGYIDPRAAGNVWPAGQNNIADGSVAMYLNGTWLPNEIKNQTPENFRWGTFALPMAKEGGDGPRHIGPDADDPVDGVGIPLAPELADEHAGAALQSKDDQLDDEYRDVRQRDRRQRRLAQHTHHKGVDESQRGGDQILQNKGHRQNKHVAVEGFTSF